MPTIQEGSAHSTFVNVFTVAPEEQEKVVRVLAEIADEVASRSPGFVSASTHRSADGTRIFNYLQWRSPGDLAAMQQSPEFRAVAEGLRGRLLAFEEYPCEVAHVREASGAD